MDKSIVCSLMVSLAMLEWAMSSPLLAAEASKAGETAAMPEMVVEGTQADENAYQPTSATFGPLGQQSIQDMPFSVGVLNEKMLRDRQVSSLSEALNYDPSTQIEARGGMDVGRPQSRGMEGSVVDNFHIDGMNAVSTTAQPMELFERVEVIHSLTGALYGPATPAGQFNMQFKRPTKEYYNAIRASVTGDGTRLIHADVGGTPARAFGYRLNLLKEQGHGYVQDSWTNRKLIGGAIDLHLTDSTTLELNGSYYNYRKLGFPGSFSYNPQNGLPHAPDPSKKGYGQQWAGNALESTMESAKLKQDINDNWHLSIGVLHQIARRTMFSVGNSLDANRQIETGYNPNGATTVHFSITSLMAMLNGRVYTGTIRHDLVIGSTGYSWDIYGTNRGSNSVGSSDYEHPASYAKPADLTGSAHVSHTGKHKVHSEILGDTITWNDQWSTLLMGNYSHFSETSYRSGSQSGHYHDDGFGENIALMYKPIPDVTTYIAYGDTLESGGTAPSGADNDGQTLSPVRSHQLEVGTKAQMGGLFGTVALFYTRRPWAFTDPDTNRYGVEGMQKNKGVELTLQGKATDNLRLMAGATYIHAKLSDGYNVAVTNKRIIGVPRWQANMLADYRLDTLLTGLSVNGNVHYVSKRAADPTNESWAGTYTTVDLGAKYVAPKFYGKKLTVRFNVTNLFDRHYWQAFFSHSQYQVRGNVSAFVGEPRQARLSATLEF